MANSATVYPYQETYVHDKSNFGIITNTPTTLISACTGGVFNNVSRRSAGTTTPPSDISGKYSYGLNIYGNASSWGYVLVRDNINTYHPYFYTDRTNVNIYTDATSAQNYQANGYIPRIAGFLLPSDKDVTTATTSDFIFLKDWALNVTSTSNLKRTVSDTEANFTDLNEASSPTALAPIPGYPTTFDFNEFTGNTGRSSGVHFYFIIFVPPGPTTQLKLYISIESGPRNEISYISGGDGSRGKSFNMTNQTFALNTPGSILLREGYHTTFYINPTNANNEGKAMVKNCMGPLPIEPAFICMNNNTNSAILSNTMGAGSLYLVAATGKRYISSSTVLVSAIFTGEGTNTSGYVYFPNAGGQISMTSSTCRFVYIGHKKSTATITFSSIPKAYTASTSITGYTANSMVIRGRNTSGTPNVMKLLSSDTVLTNDGNISGKNGEWVSEACWVSGPHVTNLAISRGYGLTHYSDSARTYSTTPSNIQYSNSNMAPVVLAPVARISVPIATYTIS